MPKTLTIATVKATGDNYIVVSIIPGQSQRKVICRGDVTTFKQVNKAGECSYTYSGKKVFLRDAVEIAQIPPSPDLFKALVMQHITHLREAGHVVTWSKSGKTYTDHGTAETMQARLEAAKQWNETMREFNREMLSTLEELGLAKFFRN